MSNSDSLSSRNREFVRRMYAAAGEGDMEFLLSCMHEDVVVVEPSFLYYGGRYEGRDAFVNLLEVIGRNLDVASVTIDSVIADGETVVVFFHCNSAGSSDVADQVHIAERLTVRNNKVVEVSIYFHELGLLKSGLV